jgi:CheY-like chemotaxis protein
MEMNEKAAVRVLLVEDDPGDQFLMRMAMEHEDLEVRWTVLSNGEEALDYLGRDCAEGRAPAPDIVLLDLNLPRVSGREVLEWIRSDDGVPWLPVIVVSTSSWERDIRRAYDEGATSYVTKPATFEGFQSLGRALCEYWLEGATLPSTATAGDGRPEAV